MLDSILIIWYAYIRKVDMKLSTKDFKKDIKK